MGGSIYDWRTRIQWVGLFSGPALSILGFLLLPTEYPGVDGDSVAFAYAGRVTLAIMIWMAVWWITEAVDISVTALLALGSVSLAWGHNHAKRPRPHMRTR